MSPSAPIDSTHRDSIDALRWVRREFALLHEDVSRWEPAACPPAPTRMTLQQEAWFAAYGVPTPERVPFLNEIERPRGWFRS